MNDLEPGSTFQPHLPDEAGVVSWVHLGDLHMTRAGEQNHHDLAQIVDEVNRAFAGGVSFVFLPGDVADDGSRSAYAVVRAELDRLNVPWCAIVGDHDVHEKSFANFQEAMSEKARYAFTVGSVRFIAMNAFDVPHPASFTINEEQMAWVESELQTATDAGQTKILLLHCYPSDLKVGGEALMDALRRFDVSLIDMGHTHYNELSNDGRTLYSATRSTGQIEEGPVGYSISNLDGKVVSWRFVELGRLPFAMITSPSDERLLTKATETSPTSLKVRAKFWGEHDAVRATAHLRGQDFVMSRVGESSVWEAVLSDPAEGVYPLAVTIEDAQGSIATDEIRIVCGKRPQQERVGRDQDNALQAWPEHGLLGTQLGPNKNGKKW